MDKTYWVKWFKAAGMRAVKTIAQTAVATVGTAAVMGEVNWAMVGIAGLPELEQK